MSATTAPMSSPSSQAHPASRTVVIVTAILSALGSSGLALGVQYYANLWAQERTEKVAEVTKFVDAAQEFDGTVTRFMGPFLKGADDAKERAAVRNNVLAQHSLVEIAKSNLDGPEAKRASAFQDSLVSVAMELDKKQPAPMARELVQAIANARAANVCVVFDLRAKVGLPVIESDRKTCLADLATYETRS